VRKGASAGCDQVHQESEQMSCEKFEPQECLDIAEDRGGRRGEMSGQGEPLSATEKA